MGFEQEEAMRYVFRQRTESLFSFWEVDNGRSVRPSRDRVEGIAASRRFSEVAPNDRIRPHIPVRPWINQYSMAELVQLLRWVTSDAGTARHKNARDADSEKTAACASSP
jgi:hypothetical protein